MPYDLCELWIYHLLDIFDLLKFCPDPGENGNANSDILVNNLKFDLRMINLIFGGKPKGQKLCRKKREKNDQLKRKEILTWVKNG